MGKKIYLCLLFLVASTVSLPVERKLTNDIVNDEDSYTSAEYSLETSDKASFSKTSKNEEDIPKITGITHLFSSENEKKPSISPFVTKPNENRKASTEPLKKIDSKVIDVADVNHSKKHTETKKEQKTAPKHSSQDSSTHKPEQAVTEDLPDYEVMKEALRLLEEISKANPIQDVNSKNQTALEVSDEAEDDVIAESMKLLKELSTGYPNDEKNIDLSKPKNNPRWRIMHPSEVFGEAADATKKKQNEKKTETNVTETSKPTAVKEETKDKVDESPKADNNPRWRILHPSCCFDEAADGTKQKKNEQKNETNVTETSKPTAVKEETKDKVEDSPKTENSPRWRIMHPSEVFGDAADATKQKQNEKKTEIDVSKTSKPTGHKEEKKDEVEKPVLKNQSVDKTKLNEKPKPEIDGQQENIPDINAARFGITLEHPFGIAEKKEMKIENAPSKEADKKPTTTRSSTKTEEKKGTTTPASTEVKEKTQETIDLAKKTTLATNVTPAPIKEKSEPKTPAPQINNKEIKGEPKPFEVGSKAKESQPDKEVATFSFIDFFLSPFKSATTEEAKVVEVNSESIGKKPESVNGKDSTKKDVTAN